MYRLCIFTIFVCIPNHTAPASIDRTALRHSGRPLKSTADYCRSYGYPAEEHEVQTKDGYSLTLFRIPWGIKNDTARTGRIPIVVQHGIVAFSNSFVLRGPEDFVFLLAEEGFDVWLSNTRGTPYSRHEKYSKNHYQFWNYTVDEISGVDLPAIIDYILDTTQQPSLAYVGHSRGCMMPTMLLGSQPEYNQKIHMLSLISPVIYSKHAKSPMFELAGERPYALMNIKTLEKLVSTGRIATALQIPAILQSTLKRICATGTMLDMICPALYFFINGVDFANVDYKIVPDLVDNLFGGMSMKEMIHILQLSAADKVQRFDYRQDNVKVYGTKEPPLYKVSDVRPPVFIYYAPNDLFINEGDLKKYIRQLPNFKKSFQVPFKHFNHLDYIFGLNTNQVFIPTFMNDIKTFHKEWRKAGH